ncbi:MAG: carboxypeptidase-like regulatory domain-containing protein, partial [Candidatus Sumerlaeota bacterium]
MHRFHRMFQRGNVNRNVLFGICALVALLLIVGIGIPRVLKHSTVAQATKQAQSEIALRDQAKARAIAEKKSRENSATANETKANDANVKISGAETKKGPRLRGRVVKASDESPIQGAVVNSALIPMLSAGKINIVDTSVSNADGAFDIPQMQVDLSEGGTETAAFIVSAEGFESQMIYAGYKETDDIVFKLGPGETISGRVVNESKAPIADVTIVLNTIQNLETAGTPEFFKPQIFSHTTTSADGSFTLKGLRAADSYRFNARAPQYDPFISEDILAGTTGVEWILNRSSGRIYGKITNADGTPTKKAYVQAYYQDSIGGNIMEMMAKIRHATTKDDGTFELQSLKPGTIMIMVMRTAGNATGGTAMRNATL